MTNEWVVMPIINDVNRNLLDFVKLQVFDYPSCNTAHNVMYTASLFANLFYKNNTLSQHTVTDPEMEYLWQPQTMQRGGAKMCTLQIRIWMFAQCQAVCLCVSVGIGRCCGGEGERASGSGNENGWGGLEWLRVVEWK